MCGRFALNISPTKLQEYFSTKNKVPQEARYNISPGTQIVVITEDAGKMMRLMDWGFIPRWAKDDALMRKPINARVETIQTSPLFKYAFQRHRCIIPASGFFEWQKNGERNKTPYYIKRKDDEPLAFAGIYEVRKDQNGSEEASCAILTEDANDIMEKIHLRMPIILARKNIETWLDTNYSDLEKLKELLKTNSVPQIESYRVSTLVNKPTLDTAECIEPIG